MIKGKKNTVQKLIGIFFLVSWVSGELLRFLWPWPMTLLDIATILLVSWFFLSGKVRLPRAATALAMTCGASWLLSLRIFSIQESLFGLLYLLRSLVYGLLIINAKSLLSPIKKYVPWALWAFISLGLFQYLFVPDTRFLLRYGWDEHYYRLIGTVLDPNYAGAMFGMIGLFALDRFLVNRKRSFALLGIASFLCLALTFSRASWIATGIALAFYVIPDLIRDLYRFQLKAGMTMMLVIALFILMLLVAPKPGGEGVNIFRTNSLIQRVESWQQALTVWRAHPFIGVGFNNYSVASQKLHFTVDLKSHAANAPDSSWLLLLSTIGVVGVTLFVLYVIPDLIRNLYRPQVESFDSELKTAELPGMTRNFILSIFLLIGIHSLFNNTLFYPPILGLLALVTVASLL